MRAIELVVRLVFAAPAALVACNASDPAAPGVLAAESDAASAAPSTPTWYRDVAPIVAANCMGCHEGGLAGPFALTSYDDVRPRHLAVASATRERRMPPWLPAEGCQSFRGARRLDDQAIDVIRRWSLAGGPLGEPAAVPATAQRVDRLLPWIDRTMDIGAEYVPRPPRGALDDRRCFLLDPQIPEDTFLVGYDLVPTRRAQVLRAVLFEAPLEDARTKDGADPGPGWACNDELGVASGRVLGRWASAFGAVTLPDGSGVRLRKGAGIVLQVSYHIHSSGHGPPAGAPDRTQVSLQLARAPVAREAEFVTLSAAFAAVPPRTIEFTVAASIAVRSGGTLWAIEPRMHLLGRRFQVELSPEGPTTCLLDIPRWDYHWEEMHFLEGTGIPVRDGSNIRVSCVWDNPTNEPRARGPNLEDEACEVALILTRP